MEKLTSIFIVLTVILKTFLKLLDKEELNDLLKE